MLDLYGIKVDNLSKEKRSKIMAGIKSKNTKIELKLRKELHKMGFRYKLHYKIDGTPDIAFPLKKIAIFVDGDFWHGYEWSKLRPKLKNAFWKDKITKNMKRDKNVNKLLNDKGWKVIRFWEHQVNDDACRCAKAIKNKLSM